MTDNKQCVLIFLPSQYCAFSPRYLSAVQTLMEYLRNISQRFSKFAPWSWQYFNYTQIILSVWEKFPYYLAHIRARIMNLAKSHERKALQFIEHI